MPLPDLHGHPVPTGDGATFNKERHVKYWLRCLKTLLPTGYTPYDANRMMLAAFIVSALDLLGALEDRTTPEERDGFVEWIYSCQHPDGGFRAFNGTDATKAAGAAGVESTPAAAGAWDPGNIAGTFFALSALLVLGDGLRRVRRKETLRWLRKLQLADGSFAEVGTGAEPLGAGCDARFCFLAVLVRWTLRNDEHDQDVPDIDVDALAQFLLESQVNAPEAWQIQTNAWLQGYDGGFAKAPNHESHGMPMAPATTLVAL